MRAIELCHQWRPLFHADLVDAVFVTVERQQTAVAMEAQAFQRIQDEVGRELGKWGGMIGHAGILQAPGRAAGKPI